MNKEIMKTAALTVLIVISLLFTWNMWTLQPPYEELQNNSFFESIPISQEKKELYEVIKPQQLFFHTGENHYSTLNADYLNSLWTEMQGWKYTEVKIQSPSFTKEQFQSWLHGKEGENLELRFYDEIPMSSFQSMIQWDAETNVNLAFDRILLNIQDDSEIQKVYFISYDKMKIIESSVSHSEASRFVAELYNKRENFLEYFSFDTGQGNEIMLPENKVELGRYQYFTEDLKGEKFKNALFRNPSIVKQDVNSSKNRYTDGTRVLNIFPSNHLVNYVNPTIRDTNSVEANLLIEQSILFLNEHGGWTDPYILFDTEESNQETKFIMSIDSIPVINSTENPFGTTMISQRWGQSEIAIYNRPSYQLIEKLSSETSTLMSGKKVAELVTNNEQLDKAKIKNIYIAYELGSLDNHQIVKVSPFWCIEMKDGNLMKINEVLEQPEGDENGVE